VAIAKHMVTERDFQRRYGFWPLFSFLIRGAFRGVIALVRLPWRALGRR